MARPSTRGATSQDSERRRRMPLRPWPARAKDLTRLQLVLAPRGWPRGRLLRGVALLVSLLLSLLVSLLLSLLLSLWVGAAGRHVYWREQFALAQHEAAPMAALRQAEQALSRTTLQLHIAQAHGRGLEQQIDGLNQRLRACMEQVTFFRKGRDARRPTPQAQE